MLSSIKVIQLTFLILVQRARERRRIGYVGGDVKNKVAEGRSASFVVPVCTLVCFSEARYFSRDAILRVLPIKAKRLGFGTTPCLTRPLVRHQSSTTYAARSVAPLYVGSS
jgi:hypothetical protein